MFGDDSQAITSAADAVLICGTTVLPEVFPKLEGVFKPDAHIIHFDLNTYEIAKNFPVTIGALANPKPALRMLAEQIEAQMNPELRKRASCRMDCGRKARDERRQRELEADLKLSNQIPLHASQFMAELAKRLPKDAAIFDEALTHSPELCRYIPQDIPGTYYQTRAGMLGTGLPGTLGLKIANPGKVVFGFSGDGSSISTVQALATAARHSIGAKFVVLNNGSYRILKYNLQRYWRDRGESVEQAFPESFDLTSPQLRFDRLAEGQGVAAVRVTDAAGIGPALNQALSDDKPFLIDLVVSGAL
jgi:thiamine pyrophosphate-dependent acetolactate synthase large subunit-like protein